MNVSRATEMTSSLNNHILINNTYCFIKNNIKTLTI